jgi:hypothetical protein
MTIHTDESELEDLSVHELHDLALDRATELADLRFLWDLLRAMPAMDAGSRREQQDLVKVEMIVLADRIHDALGTGDGENAAALRPLYIGYLERFGLPS